MSYITPNPFDPVRVPADRFRPQQPAVNFTKSQNGKVIALINKQIRNMLIELGCDGNEKVELMVNNIKDLLALLDA